MKIFSLFLPQFYETEYNNEWWGDGFTEWTNVKRAKPLYDGHQIAHPLEDNYYNMLDKETMRWQTDVMKEYGLYGMVYYHYYFNGRLLLEKPAENLLQWKDIDQPFFFCWANHSWNRAWNGSKEVLVQQTYGKEKEWRKHFEYLLPFFKDERYEKEDNRPLFMIYHSFAEEEIFNKMLGCFDIWCKEVGFSGIRCIREIFHYPSESEIDKYCGNGDYLYTTQPLCGRSSFEKRNIVVHCLNSMGYRLSGKGYKKKPLVKSGNNVYQQMIKMAEKQKNRQVIPGVFFGWDNTPRHENRGFVIEFADKSLFMKYMDSIGNAKYAIVNAWNEWAEGMILEPTKEYGYRNLEWIKEWIDKHKS